MNKLDKVQRKILTTLNHLCHMDGTTNHRKDYIDMPDIPDLSKIPSRRQRRLMKRGKR